MRKGFLFIFPIIMTVILASCSLTMGSDKITTIPKTENTGGPRGDANQPGDGSGLGKSDLDEKGDVLQADTEEYIKSIIEERSLDVLTAIAERDYQKLSEAVHPEKGVRFTPYAYVDEKTDLVFSADEIRNMASDTEKYVWGSYDGSGDPIELSFNDYVSRFVYDAEFIHAEQTGYNKILGQGNSINNSFEFYRNAIIVEYHFSGFDPRYEGMDWRSLRLVFEKAGDTWYLVGVIHDEWTI